MLIIDKVDFKRLIDSLNVLFTTHLNKARLEKIEKQLIDKIEILADANLLCYKANMTVIAERKKSKVDTQLISDMELQARTVGEQRVKSKAVINSLLNNAYPYTNKQNPLSENWMSDDIVYSVGEMIDRLTIEQIKVEDYQARLRELQEEQKSELESRIKQSQKWTSRVLRYLDLKLKEIDRKGFYECVEETRTYDLGGITNNQTR